MALKNHIRRRLAGLLDKYNFPLRSEDSHKRIEKLITTVSSRMNRSLPEDYLYFLANYRGHEVHINQHAVILWDADEVLEMNEGGVVFEFLDDVLSIGGNGGGECIGLDFSTTPSSVVLFPLISCDKENFFKIGDSLLDCIERLDRGIPWFS